MKARLVTLALALVLQIALPVLWPSQTRADGLNNRSVEIGSSTPSQITTYVISFDITFAASLGSINLEVCANSPIPGDACTPPAGFDLSAAVLDNQTGETGFSIDPGVTANNLLLTRVPAVATPQPTVFSFSGIQNPSTPDTTNYIRVETFASADGSGVAIEDGGLAFAITKDFSISAYVPPFLQFCVGLSISAHDCSTATGDLINFGILNDSAPNLASSQMTGATNGPGGYAISVLGTTMTSGINTITPLNIRGPSQSGASQFGINLRDNSNPNIGLNPTGDGTATAVGDYNVVNEFAFNSGDAVAISPLPTDFNTLTVSYLVNVDEDQPPGVYTATLTYVALATF